MCGGEVQPKRPGLSESDQRLLHASQALDQQAAQVPSSCISVCHMSDETGLCEGCWRSLDEIAGWGSAPAQFKREVWQRIQTRLLTRGAQT